MCSLYSPIKKKRLLDSENELNDENIELLNSEPIQNPDIRGFFSKTIKKPVEANNFVTIKTHAEVHNSCTPKNDIKKATSRLISKQKMTKNSYIVITDDDLTIDIIDSEICHETPKYIINPISYKKDIDDQNFNVKNNPIVTKDKKCLDPKSLAIINSHDKLKRGTMAMPLYQVNNFNSSSRSKKLKLSENSRKRKASDDRQYYKNNINDFETDPSSDKSINMLSFNVNNEQKNFSTEINKDNNNISIKMIISKKKMVSNKNINKSPLNDLTIYDIMNKSKNECILEHINDKSSNNVPEIKSHINNVNDDDDNDLAILIDDSEETTSDFNSSQEILETSSIKTLKINMKFCNKLNSTKNISNKCHLKRNNNDALQIPTELKKLNNQEIVKVEKLEIEDGQNNLRRSLRKSSQLASQVITSVITEENNILPKKIQREDILEDRGEVKENDVLFKKKEKKLKLAPIFVKKTSPKKLPEEDVETLRIRKNFLMSGIPDELKKKNFQNTVATNLLYKDCYFPKIIHINQLQFGESLNKLYPTNEIYSEEKLYLDSLYNNECELFNQQGCFKFNFNGKIAEFPLKENKICFNIKNFDGFTKSKSKRIKTNAINNEISFQIKADFEKEAYFEIFSQKTICINEKVHNNLKIKNNSSFLDDSGCVCLVDKYFPENISEFLGNNRVKKRLQDWLISWRLNITDNIQASDEDSRDSVNNLGNTILILGPSACGKTALVYAVATQLGFKVFEVNTSSWRDGKHLLAQLQEATQSHQLASDCSTKSVLKNKEGENCKLKNESNQLLFMNKVLGKDDKMKKTHVPQQQSQKSSDFGDSKKMSLILFDDVDIILDGDKGFWPAVQKFITIAKRPIILTASNKYFLSKFELKIETLIVEKLTSQDIASYLQLILLAENKIRPSRDDLLKLIDSNDRDLRKCLHTIDFWSRSGAGRNQVLLTPLTYDNKYLSRTKSNNSLNIERNIDNEDKFNEGIQMVAFSNQNKKEKNYIKNNLTKEQVINANELNLNMINVVTKNDSKQRKKFTLIRQISNESTQSDNDVKKIKNGNYINENEDKNILTLFGNNSKIKKINSFGINAHCLKNNETIQNDITDYDTDEYDFNNFDINKIKNKHRIKNIIDDDDDNDSSSIVKDEFNDKDDIEIFHDGMSCKEDFLDDDNSNFRSINEHIFSHMPQFYLMKYF